MAQRCISISGDAFWDLVYPTFTQVHLVIRVNTIRGKMGPMVNPLSLPGIFHNDIGGLMSKYVYGIANDFLLSLPLIVQVGLCLHFSTKNLFPLSFTRLKAEDSHPSWLYKRVTCLHVSIHPTIRQILQHRSSFIRLLFSFCPNLTKQGLIHSIPFVQTYTCAKSKLAFSRIFINQFKGIESRFLGLHMRP